MQIDLHLFIAAVLCFLPTTLVLAVIFRKSAERRERKRSPFKELQRRPAGETCRIKIEDLDYKISFDTMMLPLFPLLMGLGLVFLHPKDVLSPLIFFILSAGWSVVFGIRLPEGSSRGFRLVQWPASVLDWCRLIPAGSYSLVLSPIRLFWQAKYPTCGIRPVATSGHVTEKTGKATGRVPQKKARRPHISAVFTQNRHF